MMKFKKIAVFCGSSPEIHPKYDERMFQLGQMLAEKDSALIFGIGDEGLMGQVFRGTRSKNGYVIGVTTQKLLDLQCKDESLFDNNAEKIVVENLSVRKDKMIQDADAILIGPGGWGTYDEFSEFAVMVQIGTAKRKPMLFLNFDGFWNAIKDHMRRMREEGFINEFKDNFIGFADTLEEVYPSLEKMREKIDAYEEQGN